MRSARYNREWSQTGSKWNFCNPFAITGSGVETLALSPAVAGGDLRSEERLRGHRSVGSWPAAIGRRRIPIRALGILAFSTVKVIEGIDSRPVIAVPEHFDLSASRSSGPRAACSRRRSAMRYPPRPVTGEYLYGSAIKMLLGGERAKVHGLPSAN